MNCWQFLIFLFVPNCLVFHRGSVCIHAVGYFDDKKCRYAESSKNSFMYYIRCSGENPRFYNFTAKENITKLVFKSGTVFTNISILEELRTLENLETVMLKSDLGVVDWNWFPSSMRSVSIFYWSSIRFKSSYRSGDCDIRPDFNIKLVGIYFIRNLTDMPSCLPDSISTLSISGSHPDGDILKDFNKETQNKSDDCKGFKWPSNLVNLKFENIQFNKFTYSMFCNLPNTLRTIFIEKSRHNVTNIGNFFPLTITTMSIQYCGLQETTEDNFNYLSNLTNLNLKNNLLKKFPVGLPKSLLRLDLSYNQIETISDALASLPNLENLNVNSNRIILHMQTFPSSLRTVEFNDNGIEYVPPNIFTNISKLHLNNNKLKMIPPGLPSSLLMVELKNNEISVILDEHYKFCLRCLLSLEDNPLICTRDLFNLFIWIESNYPQRKIRLNGKCSTFIRIKSIEDEDKVLADIRHYSELKCNYDLDTLECNNSANLERYPRSPWMSLKVKININNLALGNLPRYIYQNQTDLEGLKLNYNGITEFPVGLPPLLVELNLNFNNITSLNEWNQNELMGLKKLKYLSMIDNRITFLTSWFLMKMPQFRQLEMRNNPLNCTCYLMYLAEYFEQMYSSYLWPFKLPTCAAPENMKNRLITSLISSCRYETICSQLFDFQYIDCSKRTSFLKISWSVEAASEELKASYYGLLNITIALNYSEISDVQIKKAFFNFTRINLSNNLLSVFPTKSLGKVLQSINLTNNVITSLPSNLQDFKDLKSIDIRNNKIIVIDANSVMNFKNIPSIKLFGNPLRCDCSQKHFTIWLESENLQKDNKTGKKPSDDVKNLICDSPTEQKGKKLLEILKENNDLCSKPSPTNVALIATIILICISGFIFIIFAFNRHLKKKRKKRESEDIVTGFKELLERENKKNPETGIGCTENYEFDVFISFSHEDEDLAYSVIKELEENRNRKVCFHERDFVAGKGIADNIVDCIGKSARVALIISRSYTKSSWCQYEVQISLSNMHARRRGKFLIPITVQKDADNQKIIGNLESILSDIPGLSTPSKSDQKSWNTFWDKLESYLP